METRQGWLRQAWQKIVRIFRRTAGGKSPVPDRKGVTSMGKLVVVSRDRMIEGTYRLKELIEKDPHARDEHAQIEREEAAEKNRRDAEHAANQRGASSASGQDAL